MRLQQKLMNLSLLLVFWESFINLLIYCEGRSSKGHVSDHSKNKKNKDKFQKQYEQFASPEFYKEIPGVADIFRCFKQQMKYENGRQHPFIGLTIMEVIKAQGYPAEDHKVVTEDGYILHIFRIPSSEKSPVDPKQKKKVIMLNHGMTANGQEFLIQWGNRNLALLLADSGFDVFVCNTRGTRYSSGHVNLSSTDDVDKSYWDFSWDEMGRYDVPAMIHHILNVTESEHLYYVGHSMGTTAFFVAMSQLPDLNQKILTAFLFTPSAYIGNTASIIKLLAPLTANGDYLNKPYVGGKVETTQEHVLQLRLGNEIGEFCSPAAIQCVGCSNFYMALAGYDGAQTNYTEVPYIMSIFPDPISTKCLFHYSQSVTTGRFRQFDYGDSGKNEKRYGPDGPQDYDLSKITAPTVFFYALGDRLTVPKDVELTASKMGKGSVKKMFIVADEKFTHGDFATAKHARELVYDHVVSFMKKGTYDQGFLDS